MLTFRELNLGIWMASKCPRLVSAKFLLIKRSNSAAYLRQSIILSAYETPETRAVFNTSLLNIAGKVRSERRWSPIAVPEGIDQVC